MTPSGGRSRRHADVRRAVVAGRDWMAWLAAGRADRPGHRVVVTSLPKSGTHLATKALLGLPGLRPAPLSLSGGALPPARRGRAAVVLGVDWPRRVDASAVRRRLRATPPGSVVAGHVPHSAELAGLLTDVGARVVAVVRDPRDVAVSLPPYVMARPGHFLHARFAALDDADRLLASIEGLSPDAAGAELRPLDVRLRSILGWLPDALLVRFEDLVGARGGGSDAGQLATLRRLADHVERPLDDALARTSAADLFGGTSTFRRGRIGGWRDAFAPGHVAAARERLTPLLVELGYETDRAWS